MFNQQVRPTTRRYYRWSVRDRLTISKHSELGPELFGFPANSARRCWDEGPRQGRRPAGTDRAPRLPYIPPRVAMAVRAAKKVPPPARSATGQGLLLSRMSSTPRSAAAKAATRASRVGRCIIPLTLYPAGWIHHRAHLTLTDSSENPVFISGVLVPLDLDALPLGRRQLRSIAQATGRVNLWEGSIRSGKTIASLVRWLTFVVSAPRGGELVMIGRTRESIARNLFGPLQDPSLFGPLVDHIEYTSGAPTARILGRTVHIIGASDAKAEPVIRGLTVAGAYIDELTVIPEVFFAQLLGRMSPPGAQLLATTNPDNPAHWVKRKYLDRLDRLPSWRTWHFTMDDNPSLTEDYRASTRAEFTGLFYRRFVLGHWVSADGSVYDMWDPARHVIAWDDLPPMRALVACGIDYGTTNPTSAVILGLGDDARLYLVDEYRHDPATARRRLTDGELSAELRAWLAAPHTPHDTTGARPKWVHLDPSAASLHTQLQRDRLKGLAPATNDVALGIRLTATLLSAGRLVVADRCAGFITEAPGYSWDPKATEQGEDRPIKSADHSLDAARYAIASTEHQWRRYVSLAA